MVFCFVERQNPELKLVLFLVNFFGMWVVGVVFFLWLLLQSMCFIFLFVPWPYFLPFVILSQVNCVNVPKQGTANRRLIN